MQDKEININKLNDCADELINEVNKFENDALEYQLQLNKDKLNIIDIDETKLFIEKNNNTIEELKWWVFLAI